MLIYPRELDHSLTTDMIWTSLKKHSGDPRTSKTYMGYPAVGLVKQQISSGQLRTGLWQLIADLAWNLKPVLLIRWTWRGLKQTGPADDFDDDVSLKLLKKLERRFKYLLASTALHLSSFLHCLFSFPSFCHSLTGPLGKPAPPSHPSPTCFHPYPSATKFTKFNPQKQSRRKEPHLNLTMKWVP